jgi:hypothetical protein
MRTPKRLYAEERIVDQPEVLTCLHCGDLAVPWNYLAWDKIVQTLDAASPLPPPRPLPSRGVSGRACVCSLLWPSAWRLLAPVWL